MDIDITCPHCNRLDLAQSVPAVHAEGVSTNSGPTPTPVWGVASTGLVPVIGTATAGSRAHQCARPGLACEPAQLPTGGVTLFGLLLLVRALFVVMIGIDSLRTSTDRRRGALPDWLGPISLLL